MRESNFHFPSHNKASVCITSALYDRRAIDSTASLPLLSTLTHLSYLTSTSPRIREILCSDGGLERLITILRSTGKRMREERELTRASPSSSHHHHPIQYANNLQSITSSSSLSTSSNRFRPDIKSSPFKSFLAPSKPAPLHDVPPYNNVPLAAHQAATVGLSKEQKQLLWTWSLSFQCVVNVGVRGSELVRTRVVEAGVVPVIISVLGGYLHEMERIRQQSEARERAKRKSALLIVNPQPSTSISSFTRSLSPNEVVPRRPVLSPRTLVHTNSRPTQNFLPSPTTIRPNDMTSITATLPMNASGLATSVTNARPSPPRLSISGRRSSTTANVDPNSPTLPPPPHSSQPSTSHHHDHQTNRAPPQLSARSDGSGTIGPTIIQTNVNPISIHSTNNSAFRTGSISPSSVSSSSSLEISQMIHNHNPHNSSQQHHHHHHHLLVRNVTPDTLQSSVTSVSGSGSEEAEMEDSNTVTDQPVVESQTRQLGSTGGIDTRHTADYESEGDVVMELVGNTEPGPSNSSEDLNGSTRRRTRRGTIKVTNSRRPSLVQITPLGPPPTTVTDLDDDDDGPSFSNSRDDNGVSPMEGIETSGDGEGNDDPDHSDLSPNPGRALYNSSSHQTPRASSTRLPVPNTITQRRPDHHDRMMPSAHADDHDGDDDVTMAGPSDFNTSRASLRNLLNDSPPRPLHPPPPPRPHRLDEQSLTGAQLQRIFSDTSEADDQPVANATTNLPLNDSTTIPIMVTNPGTPPLPPTHPTNTAPVFNPTTTPANNDNNTNPSHSATPTASATLGFRDEDVLLALQLLAYLSKYPHVRAYFHEPASRATLELTYGSMVEATKALARFIGRYKSDRYERERAKEAILASAAGLGSGGFSHTTAGSSTASRRSASVQLSAEWVAATPPPNYGSSGGDGSLPVSSSSTTPPNRTAYPPGHHASQPYLHRPTSSGGPRESRNSRTTEAYELVFSTREPIYSSTQPPQHRPHPSSGTFGSSSYPSSHQPQVITYHLAESPDHSHPSYGSTPRSNVTSIPINPLSTNVFSYVERFTHRKSSTDPHTPSIPNEIQYWAGVIMRNACRKDDERGGIRQCANMQCGRWENYPREFAKCRRCRKAKYCSKACQSKAWQLGHRFWCCTKSDQENAAENALATAATAAAAAAVTAAVGAGVGVGVTDVEPMATDEAVEEPEPTPTQPVARIDTPMNLASMGEDETEEGGLSRGSTTRANSPPINRPTMTTTTIVPSRVVDAAIARLRRRRSTISLVGSNPESIATPPDQEPVVGVGVLTGLVPGPTTTTTGVGMNVTNDETMTDTNEITPVVNGIGVVVDDDEREGEGDRGRRMILENGVEGEEVVGNEVQVMVRARGI